LNILRKLTATLLLFPLATLPQPPERVPLAGSGTPERDIGRISLKTSDAALAAAFEWARRQALAFAFTGDPVGDWYEAALPGRQAFCMRDTAHQSMGAHVLGLGHFTHNMLRKFAENISESRDWCSFWEIDRNNLPASVDYLDDAQFWYNLPANFDILDACYRMYVWTGDRSYVSEPVFLNFYRRTVYDYVDRWDLSVNHIMDRQRILNTRGRPDPANRFQRNRGIPSYDEGNPNFVVAADQLAAQYAGYVAYARIQQIRGEDDEARKFLARADEVKSLLNRVWWDKDTQDYYSRVNLGHHLEGHGLNSALLYYGAAESGTKSEAVLRAIIQKVEEKTPAVEGQSYLAEIFYRYGTAEKGYDQILDLSSPGKYRHQYPEASFSLMGAIVTGLMGIEVEGAEPKKAFQNNLYVDGTVVTVPRLTPRTEWAMVEHVPVRANEITVRHDGLKKTTVTNVSGPSLIWKACFPGSVPKLVVDGKATKALRSNLAASAQAVSCTTVDVGSGDTRTARAAE
jgi:hypothetical protein